ncbi:snRNA-activating protein complex subunit [Apostasia shenzhenica]|uniref:snRNA-activating protein complex subunit n=1 Tax=Apostasia shenzhenica TaxID=1088818 RepID=A0A2I0AAF4_9ASPA|nr:snRNA-activating protein complex subunit [Apostasia shenzhenica]
MEENNEDYCHDHVNHLSFARGGPIFAPYHPGPLTSVPDFKASLLLELQDLEAELISADNLDVGLSVDELRVFTEDEFVDKALKEEFEHEMHDESLQILEHVDIDSSSPALPKNVNLSEILFRRITNQPCIPGREIVCFQNLADESSTVGSSNLLNDSSVVECVPNVSEKKPEQKRNIVTIHHIRGTSPIPSSTTGGNAPQYCIKGLVDLASRMVRLAFASLSRHGGPHWALGYDLLSVVCLDVFNMGSSTQGLRSTMAATAMKTQNLQEFEFVPLCYPEVVLCIEIYRKQSIWRKIQEFLVLGSQYLTELRDNIYCLTDTLMQTAGKYDPSGYFLIEDTFCNDIRNPSAFDYSKPIFDWLQNCRNEAAEKWEFIMSGELKKKQKELLGNLDISNLPNFKAADMHKIRFCDLRFRLGANYFYCHQGNCNHTIVIRDMRLIHPDDSRNRSDYPLLSYQIRTRQRKCSVCQIYPAAKMTVDDKWAQENPCYFCIKCYFLLHYKEDNTLLYPHTVYDYFHE